MQIIHDLIDGAIARARTTLTIMAVAVIAGVGAYAAMPREADPDIPIPFVGVTIPLEGISPEDAERLLVRPAETELQTVEGLKKLTAVAAEGAAQIIAEFEVGFDQDQAVLDIREAIDLAKREFPQEAREPIVSEINVNLFPVLTINLYGDLPERSLDRAARELQDRLEQTPGVLEANIRGSRDELLEIVVDPAKLDSYNITFAQLLQAVTANNRLVTAGSLDTGEGRFSVKVPGLIERAQDVFAIPLLRSGDAVVTLGDVAEVRRTYKDREVYARFNGQPSVSIEVVKRSGANIVDTVASAKAVADALAKESPSTLKVSYTGDTSTFIFDSLSNLENSLISAVLLVMILVVAMLGVRSAVLVGLAIPACFLMSFLVLDLMGVTLNMMVMFGLVIAVGILVDGGIVVVEYADRMMASGLDRRAAYSAAAKRMLWPVVTSTLTTLAAFIPFLFWNTIPGKFMSFLPITLIVVLSVSLVTALIFTPVLGALFGKAEPQTNAAWAEEDTDPRTLGGPMGAYAKFMDWCVHRPLITSAVALVVIVAIVAGFASKQHKTEFFLDAEPDNFLLFVSARGNLAADAERALVLDVERRVAGISGIESIVTTSGRASRGRSFGDGGQSSPPDTIGRILIDLLPDDERRDGREIEADIRKAVADIPGIRVELRQQEAGPPQGKDIQIELTGTNGAALFASAVKVREHLEAMPGLIEIDDTLPLPGIEWKLTVDREQAAKFGADVTQVGSAVQLVTNGVLLTRYRPDDAEDEVDIRVRYPLADRSIQALDSLRIPTPAGPVPIGSFVTREPIQQVQSVQRQDGRRILIVRANVSEQGTQAARIAEIQDWLKQARIDPSVQVKFAGSNEETENAAGFFGGAILAILFMMGIILLWQFNNFYHVVLTLSAVILSTVGVLLGIWLTFPYISIVMVGTGIVSLMGVVVANNIVLIDTYQHLRQRGFGVDDAILRTACQRLRPVFLTAMTTTIGLLPAMFKLDINFADGVIGPGGQSAEWWTQLSAAIVWGLTFATMLTLVLTPVWLGAPMRISRWWDRTGGRLLPRKPAIDPNGVPAE